MQISIRSSGNQRTTDVELLMMTIQSSRRERPLHSKLVLPVFGVLLVASFLAALCIGRYSVPVGDVVSALWNSMTGQEGMSSGNNAFGVVIGLRLPRALEAILVGSALSLAGASYQGAFRNPLVAPDILGVSTGSCVGASVAILLSSSSAITQLFAFAGGMISVIIAILIPRVMHNNSTVILVLSGIIVNGIGTSFLALVKYIADPDTQLAQITYWQLGSIAKSEPRNIIVFGPVIFMCSLLLILMRWQLNVLSAGEQDARMLGIPARRSRTEVIVFATLLTSSAVCLAGTVAWVGLVVPHVCRAIIGPDNRRLLPASLLLGGVFLLFIDTLARSLTGAELPLGVLTGFIGAPFFFGVLLKQKAHLA